MQFSRPAFVLIPLCCMLSVAACSYPTSVVTIPSAQMVGDKTLLLEASNYGYPDTFRNGSLNYLMFEYGIGPDFEFGADRASDGDTQETYWNGKYRLLGESAALPEISFGAMDLADSMTPTFYSVATKSFNNVRLHAGFINGSYSHGIISGIDMDAGDKWWFGVDYLPGDENFLRFGAAYKTWGESWLTLSVGSPNNRSISDTEIGITFSTYIDLSGE